MTKNSAHKLLGLWHWVTELSFSFTVQHRRLWWDFSRMQLSSCNPRRHTGICVWSFFMQWHQPQSTPHEAPLCFLQRSSLSLVDFFRPHFTLSAKWVSFQLTQQFFYMSFSLMDSVSVGFLHKHQRNQHVYPGIWSLLKHTEGIYFFFFLVSNTVFLCLATIIIKMETKAWEALQYTVQYCICLLWIQVIWPAEGSNALDVPSLPKMKTKKRNATVMVTVQAHPGTPLPAGCRGPRSCLAELLSG